MDEVKLVIDDKEISAQQDIQALDDLSDTMMLASLCGLGQAAAIPVLDTLKYFRDEYETRIRQSVFLRSMRGKL
jgi:NADH:ubiquinone oxidoreductase subunit F (NADH-binding)